MRFESFFIFCLLVVFCLTAQQSKKSFQEYVDVTNVEVAVRVFDQNQPVNRLKKEDFILLENNEPREINGFFIYKKKLAVEKHTFETSQNLPPRYFVLSFDVIDFTPEMAEALNYFFKKIFLKQDKLLLFVNGRTVFWEHIINERITIQQIEEIVKKTSFQQKAIINNLVKIVEDLIRNKLVPGNEEYEKLYFILENYLRILREYKKSYLSPTLYSFYEFAGYLEKIDLEKWVINFYQQKLFPRLKISEENRIRLTIGELMGGDAEQVFYAKKMMKLLDDINFEINSAKEVAPEDIAKRFSKYMGNKPVLCALTRSFIPYFFLYLMILLLKRFS